jgi:hypothetical protein
MIAMRVSHVEYILALHTFNQHIQLENITTASIPIHLQRVTLSR